MPWSRPSGGWGLAALLVATLLTCSAALCYLDRSASVTLIGAHSYPADSGTVNAPSQDAGYVTALFAIFFGVILSVLLGRGRNSHATIFRPLLAGNYTLRSHYLQRSQCTLLQVFRL